MEGGQRAGPAWPHWLLLTSKVRSTSHSEKQGPEALSPSAKLLALPALSPILLYHFSRKGHIHSPFRDLADKGRGAGLQLPLCQSMLGMENLQFPDLKANPNNPEA